MSTATVVKPEIEVGDVLKVTGNGLAVRAGPGSHHPLVSEFLFEGEEPIVTKLRDEVRLTAGHFVRAVVGPIVVDETTWYAVANVPQDREAWEDVPLWRSVAPVPYTDSTELLADSFVCASCKAGWIENDNQVEPIKWVRPWYCDH